MIRKIPENHRWTGPYLGNYQGDLWKTFNVDLDAVEGNVKLSYGLHIVADTSELAMTNKPVNFLVSDADCLERFWGVTNDQLIKGDSTSNNIVSTDSWILDTLANSPTSQLRDFTIHGKDSRNDSGRDKLIVTTDSDIWVLNDTGNNAWTANWWVTKQGQPALNTGANNHPIEYFPFRKISLIGDGNLVHTISRPSDTQNDTVSYARLVVPKDYEIVHIFTTTNRAWICCRNVGLEKKGAIVEWDGFTSSYNNLYPINAPKIMSGVNYNDNPLVLTSKGDLLEFNGSSFVPMIRNGNKIAFPSFFERQTYLGADATTNFGGMSPHGMGVSEEGLVYFNLQDVNEGFQLSTRSFRQSGGIWCLNPATGRLYNKYSLSANTTLASDTGTYGHQRLPALGAGAIMTLPDDVYRVGMIVGGTITDSGSVSRTKIWRLRGPLSSSVSWALEAPFYPNRGYFITQYIPAKEIKEFWNEVYVKLFRKLEPPSLITTTSSTLIVKARGTNPKLNLYRRPLALAITWTSTITFTATNNNNSDTIDVGDEVEVLNGNNAGRTAHITSVSGSHGALQTFTIDEAQPSGTGSSDAVFDNWKKLGTFSRTNTIYEKFSIGGIDSNFIQFKVELRGIPDQVEVQGIAIASNNSLKIE